jgi:hypothetical protein
MNVGLKGHEMVEAKYNSPNRRGMFAILSSPIGDGFMRKDLDQFRVCQDDTAGIAHRPGALI